MTSPSPVTMMGSAFAATIVDPATPKALLDKMLLMVSALRDELPQEQMLDVWAAEAVAVFTAYAELDQTESLQSLLARTPPDEPQETPVESTTHQDIQ